MNRGGRSRGNWYGRWRGGSFRGRWSNRRRGKSNPNNRPQEESSDNDSTTGANNAISDDHQNHLAITHLPSSVAGSQQNIIIPSSATSNSSPFPGWPLYFVGQEWNEADEIAVKTRAILKFFRKQSPVIDADSVIELKSWTIDLKQILEDDELLNDWPSFVSDLQSKPEDTLNCLGLGLHQVVVEKTESREEYSDMPVLRVRITRLEPMTQLKQIKSSFYGKLATVKGTVIRVSGTKLLCTWMAFECNRCKTIQTVRQPEGIFTNPTSCGNAMRNCKSRSFTPQLNSPYTLTANCQTIRIQESLSDMENDQEGGRVPKTIDCELKDDLVETCPPGDVVIVTGIIKAHRENEGKSSTSSTYIMYIDAISIINLNHHLNNGTSEVQLEEKDFHAIKEMHDEPDIFRLLVHSLCPAIFGHELVKAGILLCLAGGGNRRGEDVTGRRAEPHMLLVGDPGLGKSRLLQAATHVAPRGVYVCGNTSTAAGLTVTVKAGGGGQGGGDYTLEAGALLLADGGCCCIDEFDKMTDHHQSLLEAMEQQSVSIAKAGLVCNLPARTSIIAAANPVGGHYTRAKTVAENLKLSPALLSRFDLVFILLDQPNERTDSLLSEHVMAQHAGVRGFASDRTSSMNNETMEKGETSQSEELSHRLKVKPGEELDLVPAPLIRKYIAYARKYVNPRLSEGAAQILQEFYLQLRQRTFYENSTPVTTRQLESLIRLTEAKAKLELREEATEKDAADTISILQASMADVWTDDNGDLILDRSLDGSTLTSTNKAKKFVAALQKRAQLQMRNTFTVAELKEVAKLASISVMDFTNFLNTLNLNGFLLKKGTHLYQLLAADF